MSLFLCNLSWSLQSNIPKVPFTLTNISKVPFTLYNNTF